MLKFKKKIQMCIPHFCNSI